jgi:hypothetical protein
MEFLRWMVTLTVYPFFLIDDLIHWHEEERFIAEQKRRFIAMHEGE